MKYILLLLLILISSCDRFYSIPLSKAKSGINFSTQCGELDIELRNWQGHSFDFYQSYQLHDSLTLYKDSLQIILKNETYPIQFLREGKGYLEDNKVDLIGNSLLRSSFHIKKKVNKGDTLKIFPRGYIYCKGREVKFDSLHVIIDQDLRGPFEN